MTDPRLPLGRVFQRSLDIIVAMIGSVVFVNFFGNEVHLSFMDKSYILNPVVYVILGNYPYS